MDSEFVIEYFIIYLFPTLNLILGLTGNLLGLVLCSSKNLKKIGTLNIYKYLFVTDSLFLPQILINYLGYGFNLDLTLASVLSCKLVIYLNYFSAAISPWLLVYISLEKFISIKFPGKVFLRKKRNQNIFYLILIIYNIVYYSPILTFYNIETFSVNTTDAYKLCQFTNSDYQLIGSWMDMINRVLLPFIFMVFFTVLLVHSIFKSRRNVLNAFKSSQNKTFRREIRLSITSMFMNIAFVALEMPLAISLFIANTTTVWTVFNQLTFYLFYMSYSVNFYVMFLSNSLFRKEFFLIFNSK